MKYKDLNQELDEVESTVETHKIQDGEIIIGVFSGFNDDGKPLVNFDYNNENSPLVALASVNLNQSQIGRQTALLFVEGDLQKPIIIGLIHNQLDDILDNFEISLSSSDKPEDEPVTPDVKSEIQPVTDDVTIDGKRLVMEAKEEIVLKCGEASITLTKAGKILIRGKYLLNRSSGVNRIMGGSVQVN